VRRDPAIVEDFPDAEKALFILVQTYPALGRRARRQHRLALP
jgi:hypothetical protein